MKEKIIEAVGIWVVTALVISICWIFGTYNTMWPFDMTQTLLCGVIYCLVKIDWNTYK